jgi:hypothetical protein
VTYALLSNEQVGEVSAHDLGLLLLHLGVGVVRREDQVDFAPKRIEADDPEVARVHLLF